MAPLTLTASNASSADTAMDFLVGSDKSVRELLRLDRITGRHPPLVR